MRTRKKRQDQIFVHSSRCVMIRLKLNRSQFPFESFPKRKDWKFRFFIVNVEWKKTTTKKKDRFLSCWTIVWARRIKSLNSRESSVVPCVNAIIVLHVFDEDVEETTSARSIIRTTKWINLIKRQTNDARWWWVVSNSRRVQVFDFLRRTRLVQWSIVVFVQSNKVLLSTEPFSSVRMTSSGQFSSTVAQDLLNQKRFSSFAKLSSIETIFSTEQCHWVEYASFLNYCDTFS